MRSPRGNEQPRSKRGATEDDEELRRTASVMDSRRGEERRGEERREEERREEATRADRKNVRNC